jgi:ABC-type phosphate transport system substrate-binding protein
MRVRTTRLTATMAVAVTTIGMSLALAVPAHAADADDPGFAPVSADLIGVGSDTTQHAVHVLAEGAGSYSALNPTSTFRIASFAATGGGTIALPSGSIPRPNGSGAGKSLLYGAGNVPEVDFARSSSAQNATETGAGLQSFPFALDTLAMAVSNSVPSNAPASITPEQILRIYKGTFTNWNQLGGPDAAIAPKIPQAGSGTRSFFIAQLQAIQQALGEGTSTITPVGAEVQEHDDTAIKSDPNAIAPFSIGRAKLLGTTLRIEAGWKADRALYNVVRGADLGRADLQAAFGSDGFLCSVAARPLIEAAGFQQLAPPVRGGVCGAATQAATTNFTLNQAVATATALKGTSTKANAATLVAQVTGAAAPTGSVSFFDAAGKLLASGVPLVSGQATRVVTGLAPGTATYRAVFAPSAGSQFEASSAVGAVFVKTSSTLKETFDAKVKLSDEKAKGKIKVKLVGITAAPQGKVTLKLGTSKVGSVKLVDGAARFVIKVKNLEVGKNKLKATWNGDANAVGSKLKFTIKRTK